MCPICDRLVHMREHLMGRTVYCVPAVRNRLSHRFCLKQIAFYYFLIISNFLILTLKILYVRRWKVLAICEDSQYYIGG